MFAQGFSLAGWAGSEWHLGGLPSSALTFSSATLRWQGMLLPWGVSVLRRLPRDRVRVVERTGSGPRRSEAMNQSRRWAAWMATLLILLGLAILPREGAAWGRYIDPIELVLFGEPDVPVTSVVRSPQQWDRIVFGRIMIVRAGTVPMILFVPKE